MCINVSTFLGLRNAPFLPFQAAKYCFFIKHFLINMHQFIHVCSDILNPFMCFIHHSDVQVHANEKMEDYWGAFVSIQIQILHIDKQY